jgi:hypothetical protein
MFNPNLSPAMETQTNNMLSKEELAKRWGLSTVLIGLYSAIGLGPRFVREDGMLKFPIGQVREFERSQVIPGYFSSASAWSRTVAPLV